MSIFSLFLRHVGCKNPVRGPFHETQTQAARTRSASFVWNSCRRFHGSGQASCSAYSWGLTILAFYTPVGAHPFANYDDPAYVSENQHVKAGLTWNTSRWPSCPGRRVIGIQSPGYRTPPIAGCTASTLRTPLHQCPDPRSECHSPVPTVAHGNRRCGRALSSRLCSPCIR